MWPVPCSETSVTHHKVRELQQRQLRRRVAQQAAELLLGRQQLGAVPLPRVVAVLAGPQQQRRQDHVLVAGRVADEGGNGCGGSSGGTSAQLGRGCGVVVERVVRLQGAWEEQPRRVLALLDRNGRCYTRLLARHSVGGSVNSGYYVMGQLSSRRGVPDSGEVRVRPLVHPPSHRTFKRLLDIWWQLRWRQDGERAILFYLHTEGASQRDGQQRCAPDWLRSCETPNVVGKRQSHKAVDVKPISYVF